MQREALLRLIAHVLQDETRLRELRRFAAEIKPDDELFEEKMKKLILRWEA